MKQRLAVKPSERPGAGKGLFATKPISSGNIVCEYDGFAMSMEAVMEAYLKDKEETLRTIIPFVRIIDNASVVVGSPSENNFLNGVFVNDYTLLTATSEDAIHNYNQVSAQKANVEAIADGNRVWYKAKRKIQKGEELYSHYGTGYWLLHLGVSPSDLINYLPQWS